MIDDDWQPFEGVQSWIDAELPKIIEEQVAPMLDAEFGPKEPGRAKRLAHFRALLEGKVREVERRARDRIDAEAATKH
jgi:hypothetical protein